MPYTESGVRLRQRGLPTLALYKAALIASLIVNAMFAAGLWNQGTIVAAVGKVQTVVAFLN